jgi:hypothetical protein
MKVKWKFKKDAIKQETSEDFWYALLNGYINLEEVLEGEDLARAKNALNTLNSLESALIVEELLEMF